MIPFRSRPLVAGTLTLALAFLPPGCKQGREPKAGAKAGGGARTGSAGPRRVPVEVRVVGRQAVVYNIDTVGTLEADEVVRIPARVGGVIEDIRFREGMRVERGTLLARIDPERYRLAAVRAAAAAAQAEAELHEAEAALAKREALRAKDPGWVSAEELSNASARVDAQKAALAAARAALDLARKDERDSEVRATAPGVINQKLADTGQFLGAGTPIASVIDDRRLRLSFHVAESESARITTDSEIRFRVRSLPGSEFRARLYHVGQAAERETREVPCLAWVEGERGGLRSGFFAELAVLIERRDALVVPTSAALASEHGFVAWVMTGEDTAERRLLKLGLHTRDGNVEVLDGLAEGERIVVRGGAAMRPGAKVEVKAAVDAAAARAEAEAGAAGAGKGATP